MTDNFPRSAQFIDTYFPNIDGVVRTVHNYAKAMNKLSYSCVVAPVQNENDDSSLGYDVFRLPSLPLPIQEYRLSLPSISRTAVEKIADRKLEIFHTHSPFTIGRYGLKLARKLRVPIVTTFHSKYYDDVKRLTRSSFIAEEAVKLIVEYYQKVDSVWTVSRGTASTLRDYGFTGDIYVIDNGCEYTFPDNADTISARAAEKWKLRKDVPVLLFVGHQIWQKNLKLLLDTLVILKQRYFAFQAVIVGDGYAASQIQSYAESVGVKDDVIFTGLITNREELQGLYLMSDLFFFPSVYDNSPLVVREAASMALPSLLVSGSNAADVITDSVNGFTADETPEAMAKKIEYIFAHPGLLENAGKNACELCVSWEETVLKAGEKYREIIDFYSKKEM